MRRRPRRAARLAAASCGAGLEALPHGRALGVGENLRQLDGGGGPEARLDRERISSVPALISEARVAASSQPGREAGVGSSCRASLPVRKCWVTCFIENSNSRLRTAASQAAVETVAQPAPCDNRQCVHRRAARRAAAPAPQRFGVQRAESLAIGRPGRLRTAARPYERWPFGRTQRISRCAFSKRIASRRVSSHRPMSGDQKAGSHRIGR